MLVPVSWLRDYVDVDLPLDELVDLLTFAGFAVECVHRPSAGAKGVRVAEVKAVDKIAGSDKLHLVEVFDGERTEQVVAGASNFAPGDRVAWAQPGSVLPGGFSIGRKELFGVVSNGMLASARELAVGEDHRGIWVLDPDAPLGEDVAAWLELDDPTLDLEVNPDRGYGLSLLGLAHDVAAITGAALRLPDAASADGTDTGVPVTIADADRCARFDARRIEGVAQRRSPSRIQRRLVAAGIRPISAVVDATNYAMLETGHPVHAYDLARLAGPRIDVRQAQPGETLVTLDGVERTLDPDDLVIADADGPVGLAGVMGGDRAEVGPDTPDLLVEVASFDPASILRTTRRHKLFSAASARFEKTVPAETVPLGATQAARYIVEFAGGRLSAGQDHYPRPVEREQIRLRPARARSWLGMDLDDDRQRELLESIGCAVEPPGAPTLAVSPPAYRPDLREEADLYEEIARLEGYDKIPATVPSSGTAGGRSAEHDARRTVRRALAGGGWTEVLTLPFVSADDADVTLVNPLSKEESGLRTSLLSGLLRVVRHNVNRQQGELALFEVGRVFWHPDDAQPGADGGPGGARLPGEPLMLGFAAAGAFRAHRHDVPGRPADLYDVIGAAELAVRSVGRGPLTVTPAHDPPYHPGRAARLLLDGEELGVVGELHPRAVAAFEVPARTLAGELRLDRIVAGGVRPALPATPSPLPGLRFDVAVVVDEDVPAAAVEAAVRAGAGERLTACALFDVFRGEQLGEGRKSLACSVRLDDPEVQLTDADEAAAIEAIEQSVAEHVGGRLRR